MGVSWPTMNPRAVLELMGEVFPGIDLDQFNNFMREAGINSGYQVRIHMFLVNFYFIALALDTYSSLYLAPSVSLSIASSLSLLSNFLPLLGIRSILLYFLFDFQL